MTVLILSSKKNKDRTKNLSSKNKKKQGNSPIGFEKIWAKAFNGYRKPLAYFASRINLIRFCFKGFLYIRFFEADKIFKSGVPTLGSG